MSDSTTLRIHKSYQFDALINHEVELIECKLSAEGIGCKGSVVGMWSGFTWLRVSTGGGLL